MTRANCILPVIAVLTAGAPLTPAFGAADALPPAANASDAAPARRLPLITHNPDGTMTIRTTAAPARGDAKKGLVIPPQIVVPLTPPR